METCCETSDIDLIVLQHHTLLASAIEIPCVLYLAWYFPSCSWVRPKWFASWRMSETPRPNPWVAWQWSGLRLSICSFVMFGVSCWGLPASATRTVKTVKISEALKHQPVIDVFRDLEGSTPWFCRSRASLDWMGCQNSACPSVGFIWFPKPRPLSR